MKFSKPPLQEQRKIATILSSVDEAIEKTGNIIAETERVKNELMQQLLTNGIEHIKFKESAIGMLSTEWEISSLSDQIEIIDCKHVTPKYQESGYPKCRPQNIKIDRIDFKDAEFVSQIDYNFLTEKHTPKQGDIVYSRNASFGLAAFVDSDQKFCIGQDIVVMTEKKADTKFIYYLLCSNLILKQLERWSSGSTFHRINLKDIKQLLVPVPGILEQQKIASILSNVDEKIKIEKDHQKRLKNLKRGLMQDLLTGRVRVKVDGHA